MSTTRWPTCSWRSEYLSLVVWFRVVTLEDGRRVYDGQLFAGRICCEFGDLLFQTIFASIGWSVGGATDSLLACLLSSFTHRLLYLANEDPDKDITLYINSPGGSVSAGLAIFDTMKFIPCDVQTVCFGMAASMGAFLLGAGTPGKRKSLPNARIMIHQPLGGAQGQAADIEIQAKEILFTRALLNKYIADYTDQPVEKIEEDCDRDFFMTPAEALDYGIIDEGTYYQYCSKKKEQVAPTMFLLHNDVAITISVLSRFFKLDDHLDQHSHQNKDKPHPVARDAESTKLAGKYKIKTKKIRKLQLG